MINDWAATTWVPCDAVLKQENHGPAHSYNLAISRLTDDDDYVAVIDADDTWLPGKVCQAGGSVRRRGTWLHSRLFGHGPVR